MRNLTLFLTFLTLFFSNSALSYYCDLEFAPIHRLAGTRSVEELVETKIATFNVLNLEFSPGKYVTDELTGKREFVQGTITKEPEKLKEIADIIQEQKLDVIILQEVEGIEPLLRFNTKFLDDQYQVIMQNGNDTRGIEIGFLVKKDLPFDIRLHSHAHHSWINPAINKKAKIFSRDLPALHIRLKTTSMNDPPDLIVAGTHYKSQRDRSNDPRSAKLRTKQVDETRDILEGYQNKYPGTPIMLGGDFNADIHSMPEFKGLFRDNFMKDSLDLNGAISKTQRVTQSYHPRNGNTQYSQLDAILVDQNAANYVEQAKVYRYKDVDGNEKPLPKTYAERELNPSDHYMVMIKANLKKMFNKK
ncbi:MAG: endonuclease/exonuclease/phosphatase family protein [Bacteriovoracaceae bacterium]|nr:endonuclease/exonuclease/phosphatase family protein [Bacteriovoracaceae bacterium]